MFGLREYFQICASGFAGMSQREAMRIRRQGAEVVSMAAEQDIPKGQVGVNAVQMYQNSSGANFMGVFVSAGQHFAVVRGGTITPDDYQSYAREAILLGAPALRSSSLYNPLTGDFLGRVSDILKTSRQVQTACGRSKLQLIQAGQSERASSLISHFAMVRHREISELDARYMTMQMFTLQLRDMMKKLYNDEYSFDLITGQNEARSLHDLGLEDISL